MAWGTPKTWAFEETPTAANMNAEIRDRMNKLFGGASGDSEADVPHKHLAGTLASRPTPGNAGRMYYATDLGLHLFDDGTEWSPVYANPFKCAFFGSDFAETITDGDNSQWTVNASGSGGVTLADDNDTIIQINTGTTASSAVAVETRSTTSNLLATRVFLYAVRFEHQDIAAGTQVMYAGLYSTGGDSPTNAIYFRKDGTGNVFATVRSSSTDRDTADTSETGGAMTTYFCEYDGTNVKMYKDTLNSTGLLLTTSTSLPTSQMRFGFRHSVTTAPPSSRDTDIDAGYLWIANGT